MRCLDKTGWTKIWQKSFTTRLYYSHYCNSRVQVWTTMRLLLIMLWLQTILKLTINLITSQGLGLEILHSCSYGFLQSTPHPTPLEKGMLPSTIQWLWIRKQKQINTNIITLRQYFNIREILQLLKQNTPKELSQSYESWHFIWIALNTILLIDNSIPTRGFSVTI